MIANQILIDTLRTNPNVAGLASEEEDNFVAANEQGGYLVLFDPLDGSSNIDVNISIGTIFFGVVETFGQPENRKFFAKGQ